MTAVEIAATAKKSWAHIAHRDGVWCAVISAEISENPTPTQRKKWKKAVAKELASWIVDDWRVLTVYSREEYASAIGSMMMYDKKVDGEQPKLDLLQSVDNETNERPKA